MSRLSRAVRVRLAFWGALLVFATGAGWQWGPPAGLMLFGLLGGLVLLFATETDESPPRGGPPR